VGTLQSNRKGDSKGIDVSDAYLQYCQNTKAEFLTHKRFRTSLCVKLMDQGGPYMARYAGHREMRIYNDLKGHCPVRIKEFHATAKGRERCQRCPTGYATEMCKNCGKHLWQVRRLYTLESGKTIIGSCHYLWHTEEDIAQFKKLKGERSCKFTTNRVFCATGACRWRGRRPLAPLTLCYSTDF
jgi:hypothetical protein